MSKNKAIEDSVRIFREKIQEASQGQNPGQKVRAAVAELQQSIRQQQNSVNPRDIQQSVQEVLSRSKIKMDKVPESVQYMLQNIGKKS